MITQPWMDVRYHSVLVPGYPRGMPAFPDGRGSPRDTLEEGSIIKAAATEDGPPGCHTLFEMRSLQHALKGRINIGILKKVLLLVEKASAVGL